MRKGFVVLISVIVFTMLLATVSFASAVNVFVNGDAVTFPDAAPYVNEDGRTMVPVRFVSEQLGAKVEWDEADKTVIIEYNEKKISLPLNQKVSYVDGRQVDLDTAAVIKDNRTMVPLRFVGEALGTSVLWNESTVRISTGSIDLAATSKRNNKYKSPPQMNIDPAKEYFATVKTNRGSFKIKLLASEAPATVNNFIFLAKDGFYDGVPFHRIIKGFMIQTGDPLGNGTGGPGYTFKDELPPALPYDTGIVAMANSGPNTNGSQFFICSGEQAKTLNLSPNYTVFGQISEGMDVVLKISDTPVGLSQMGEASSPLEIVYIESMEIEES